ncbi:phage tail assembly chaperone [Desulfovibrio falkowii]
MDDYPDNEKRAAFRAYRAELRGLNHEEGAPWDGGGDLTPWPKLPSVG